ncbi:MAG: DUF3450 domain-containing protein [Rhodothalassiaceae bacterium]
MQPRLRQLACSTAVAVAFALGATVAHAQATTQPAPVPPPPVRTGESLEGVFKEALELNKLAQASQETIDKTANETQKLLREYQSILKQIESLKAYNAQQRRVIRDQEQQLAELQASIDGVVAIRRDITPLMLRMIDRLDQFVSLDLPFKLEERQQRIENLRSFMDMSNISPSEKFRLVLEAYQVENEFGRTVESYVGSLPLEGQGDVQVEFLRIGRVVFVYQTQDGQSQGYWDAESRSWKSLGSEFNAPIEAALRFAKKQAAPQMYILPVSGPQLGGQ